ncbi:MAG: BspA family leucine-rich repeat surface protein [Candidatus Nomurabacteria bacterium]|nr:BspA family leucine-rich repeat surface protein [Candidatus Nomurabacteria bacterium]
MINNYKNFKRLISIVFFIFTVFLFIPKSAFAIDPNAFVTSWQTDPDDASHTITIPLYPGETYDFTVDWGEGIPETHQSDNPSHSIWHSYSTDGVKFISITGVFPRIYLNNSSEAKKLLTVENWGTVVWNSMENAFSGAINFNLNTTLTDKPNLSTKPVSDFSHMFENDTLLNFPMDNWDMSHATNLSNMFYNARSFDGLIKNWDVSSVLYMSYMFGSAGVFNQDLSAWNVSSVIDMSGMFYSASKFNQNLSPWSVSSVISMNSMFGGAEKFNSDISSWSVRNVTDVSYMFSGASNFNSDLGSWDVGQVTDMSSMFYNASSFNSDLSTWNVSKVNSMSDMFNGVASFNSDISLWNVGSVTNMSGMFNSAKSFNQNISSWNVGSVSSMTNMFNSATSFNQNLSAWNIANVTDMHKMFANDMIYTTNYDAMLTAWSSLTLQTGVDFGAGNSYYCLSDNNRANIINNFSWTISDSGYGCSHIATYSAGKNGTLSGQTYQQILDSTDGSPVTAVPDSGYRFLNWSDGSTQNPRTDTNLSGDMDVTANFTLDCSTINGLGTGPTNPVAVGNYLYILNQGSDDVSVIDSTNNTIIANIPVGTTPKFATLIGTNLYISNLNSNNVSVIDTTNNTVVATIATGNNPINSIAYNGYLYVENQSSNSVSVIDTTNNTVITTIPIGTTPAPSPSIKGTYLYIANVGSSDVSVIDLNTNTVNTTISVGTLPEGTELVGNYLYVVNYISNDISVIDTTNNTVVANINVGNNPLYAIHFGVYLYIENTGSTNVSVIDTTNNTVITTIPIGFNPQYPFIINGNYLYIPNNNASYISVIDVTNNTFLKNINTNDGPSNLAIVYPFLYSINQNVNNISVIDINTLDLFTCGNSYFRCRYIAGSHGSITGSTSQVILSGGNATTVTAVPDSGYRFVKWSDTLSTTAERTDINIGLDINANANFELIPIVNITHIKSGGQTYGCTDPRALNYSKFVASNPSLCKYSQVVKPSLGESKLCSADKILTQNLKSGARNGKYNFYTGGTVKEVKILQAHMNRLGFSSGKEDGILGPITDGAIKRMQKYLGTYTDGMIGPITRELINNSCGTN